jgi:hypothetical protein
VARTRRPSPDLLSSKLSFALATALICPACAAQSSSPPADQLPRFTADGSLHEPDGWETWVMVGSSTGLSYNTPGAAPAAGAAPGMFHNVYMQPWAYRELMKTGVFPEQTILVLSFFEASRRSAPAKAGFYEGGRVPGIEIHLKRKGIDKSGWAFFGFADTASIGGKLPPSAACYACHATEAAHDNVFTQFYPFVRDRLAKASKPDSVKS